MAWLLAILYGLCVVTNIIDLSGPKHDPVAPDFGWRRFDGFADFMERFAASDHDLCAANKSDIQTAALKVMDDTLTFLGRSIDAASAQTETNFADKMMEKWRQIFEHLASSHRWLNPKGEEIAQTWEAMDAVKESLSQDVIPLPTTTDRSYSGRHLFGYSALRNYFFLGVVPVSIIPRNSLELTSLLAHPLRSSLVRDLAKFAQHDVEHGSFIIAHNRRSLNLSHRGNCWAFNSCLYALERTPGVQKRALYYLLHEDRNVADNLRWRNKLSGLHFLDFALEHIFSKPEFDLYSSLLGHSDRERSCWSVQQFVGGYDAEKIVENLVSNDTLLLLKEKQIFASAAIPRKIKRLLHKLQARCTAEIEHLGLQLSEDPKHAVLRAGVEDLIQKGFPQILHAHVLKMMDSFDTISSAMKSRPCRTFAERLSAQEKALERSIFRPIPDFLFSTF